MRVDLFLMGYARYRVPKEDAEALFCLFQEEGISPKALRRSGKDEGVLFLLSKRQADTFARAAASRALPHTCEKMGGISLLLRRFLQSPGIVVGVILALALCLGARLLAWDVRIEGNETLLVSELESTLADCGVFRGCFLPTLDADEAALHLRNADDRVAYAAINRVGTVLYVQIVEAKKVPPSHDLRPANLVAKCDGVVTMPLIYEGECLVEAGDVVRKGQILASGLSDTQNHGYLVTRAAGQVLARTVRVYTVEIPLIYEEKVYTGNVSWDFSLIFFHWMQKVFKNTGNYIDKCDIIEKTEWITLPSGERLPLGYYAIGAAEYTYVTRERSVQEALDVAREELRALLEKECEGRVTLRQSVTFSESADGVTLVCTVVYEEDIAEVAEFTLQS